VLDGRRQWLAGPSTSDDEVLTTVDSHAPLVGATLVAPGAVVDYKLEQTPATSSPIRQTVHLPVAQLPGRRESYHEQVRKKQTTSIGS